MNLPNSSHSFILLSCMKYYVLVDPMIFFFPFFNFGLVQKIGNIEIAELLYSGQPPRNTFFKDIETPSP